MHSRPELVPNSSGKDRDAFLMVVNLRLKKLRRERQLVKKSIAALTEISRIRRSRERRAQR